MSNTHTPIDVFCSYAPEDESSFQQLQKHLGVLTHQEHIVLWHHRRITPGSDWAQAIDAQVNRASIILLLISADFLNSDYCYGVEMKRALERQRANEACVIPILVRPVDWENVPFKHLSVLPTDNKPIVLWRNRDEAFKNIVQGIGVALEDVQHLAFGTLPSPFPRLWNIPYAPNPFFTGQEALLRQLAETLKTGSPTALSQPQAISGLGGLGKTQIAVEYAYRHRQDYQAIFWVRADTHEALVSGYVALAELLNLPEKDERDQTIIVQAVERWLKTHREWLLILDNADDLSIVGPFLRSLLGGHILLTTRAYAIGPLAQRVEVETMSQEVGVLFLLRRAGLIGLDTSLETVSTSERANAQRITEELGGLPLALDQVGAYIQETGCSLARYQQVYEQHRMGLLKRRGSFSNDYPESVATAWTLSFEKVKQQSPIAADLLCCCALLHPDAIPEEFFTDAATHLGPRLQRVTRDSLVFDDAVRVLLAYSLIHRDATTTMLSIHRLVQAVLIDAMSARTKKRWQGQIIRALATVFPERPEYALEECERFLSHALVSVSWIGDGLRPIPASLKIIYKTGVYLRERSEYAKAEPLLVRALSICEQHLGVEHPDTAMSLNALAVLYDQQGEYEQAEPLYKRALSVFEQHLGAEHPDTARCLNNLGLLYQEQGKYEQAEPLYKRALSIFELYRGVEHPDTAMTLHNLARLYGLQGKYEVAELLWKRALAIREQRLGVAHPDTARNLNGLAILYRQVGKYEVAEELYKRALAIREQHLGVAHRDIADSLHGLAELYQLQGKYTYAETLYKRALMIYEQRLGSGHPDIAVSLGGLALLYRELGKYEEAELLYKRALAIRVQHLGGEHPDKARILDGLASLYRYQGKYEEAGLLYKQALMIKEQHLGSEHIETAVSLNNLAILYCQQGKYGEAEPVFQRALMIKEQHLGSEHIETAVGLNNLAILYCERGRYGKAELLYKRALMIWERHLGAEHPDTAYPLHGLATLYQRQGKYEQAEPFYQRALTIREQRLGSTHPETQNTRKNYATLLRLVGRDAEATALEANREPSAE
jgi:tetratricopeptide (TPR) repeat protein